MSLQDEHNFMPSRSEAVRSIAVDIILTLITCGLYGLYWQYRQMVVLNGWLRRSEYSFFLWLILGIVTCGIFTVYYEYKMAQGINEIQELLEIRVKGDLALICLMLTVFGLGIVSMAIQQSEINEFYGVTSD